MYLVQLLRTSPCMTKGPLLRYGSLDRRRANNGRLESRSMEHLDSLPSPSIPQQSAQHTSHHNHQHTLSPNLLHPSHAASYPHHPHYHNHQFQLPEHHQEAMDTTSDSHPNTANCSFDTISSERSGGGGGGGDDDDARGEGGGGDEDARGEGVGGGGGGRGWKKMTRRRERRNNEEDVDSKRRKQVISK